jgi:hypothetical protein
MASGHVNRANRPNTWLLRPMLLAAIMRHVARFCRSGERARAGDPTGWVGVRQLAVRRVWD